jgi:hypothetical protein
VTGVSSPNYYWAFIGLIVVTGVAYAVVAQLMPAKDFIAEDGPGRATEMQNAE